MCNFAQLNCENLRWLHKFKYENMKEMEFVFQRKLYDRMLQWKQEEQGQTALLIEGVRRVDE